MLPTLSQTGCDEQQKRGFEGCLEFPIWTHPRGNSHSAALEILDAQSPDDSHISRRASPLAGPEGEPVAAIGGFARWLRAGESVPGCRAT
jgi:hypothetical protein